MHPCAVVLCSPVVAARTCLPFTLQAGTLITATYSDFLPPVDLGILVFKKERKKSYSKWYWVKFLCFFFNCALTVSCLLSNNRKWPRSYANLNLVCLFFHEKFEFDLSA